MRAVSQELQQILPQELRLPVAIATGLATLAVLTLALAIGSRRPPVSFDRAVQLAVGSAPPAPSTLARLIDFAGEPVGLAGLAALLVGISLLLRRQRIAVLVPVGIGLSISVTSALKPLVGRTIHGANLSFPSGHTASGTALAMIAVLLLWHRLSRPAALALLYGVALVTGAAVAWAQVRLTAHYPSDTVGGWCTALAVVPATARLVDEVTARWPDRAARSINLSERNSPR